MIFSSAALAALLRKERYDAAAAAADAAGHEVMLSEASRENLISIYSVRQRIQEDARRLDVAKEIELLLEALAQQTDSEILVGQVSDAEHHHVIFMDSAGGRVLAVVVPPRRVDDPAPPLPDHRR